MVNGRRDGDLLFEGVRQNVADSRLLGWYMCYSSRYGDNNLSLVDIKQRCNGDKIMLVPTCWRTELDPPGSRPAGEVSDTGDGSNR